MLLQRSLPRRKRVRDAVQQERENCLCCVKAKGWVLRQVHFCGGIGARVAVAVLRRPRQMLSRRMSRLLRQLRRV